jgi:hypothetical protein
MAVLAMRQPRFIPALSRAALALRQPGPPGAVVSRKRSLCPRISDAHHGEKQQWKRVKRRVCPWVPVPGFPTARGTCAFSANKPDRLLSIIVQWVHFRVEAVFFTGHFVIVTCVFIHIAGSIFIFNISKGQRPVSDLEEHIREPPQWGE